MPADTKDTIYVATESGSSEVDGQPITFTRGVTRIRAGHPLLKAVPDYWKPVEENLTYEVEQATKAPGEKRKR
jgi:hypothetical protein